MLMALEKIFNEFEYGLAFPQDSPLIEAPVVSYLRDQGVQMFPYKVFGDLVFETRTKKFDYTYHMGSGRYEGTLNPNTQNLVHAVFNYACPHGDVYAYNSNTLAEDATSILQRELRNYLKNQINIDPFFDVKIFSLLGFLRTFQQSKNILHRTSRLFILMAFLM